MKNINPELQIGIVDDYLKEIDEIRKVSASFNVDRLVINGQIYRGPETQNFSFYAEVLSL